jgi:hypothetical protein
MCEIIKKRERQLDDEPHSGQQGIQALVSRWWKAVEKDGDYVEN